jgi:hypothetical protein
MKSTHWRERVTSLVCMAVAYLFICGFTGCYDFQRGFYDYITAADGQWSVTVSNGRMLVSPINNNPQNGVYMDPPACGQVAVGDPMVRVDMSNRWWYAQVVDLNTAFAECLSVTTGTDPRGPFYQYIFNSITYGVNPGDGLWLGVTGNKATLTGLFSDGTYRTIVMNRNDAVAGVFPRTATILHNNVCFRRPSQNVSPSSPNAMYLFGYDTAGSNNVQIVVITGVPGTTDTVTHAFAAVSLSFPLCSASCNCNPPAAAQPDGSTIGFPGITDSIFNGKLWIAHAGYGQAILHVAQINNLNPFQPTLRQQTAILPPDAGGGLGCPSIAANADDDVVVGYSAGSSSRWLTGYVTGRRHYDVLGSIRASTEVATGHPQDAHPGSVYRLDYCAGAMGLDGTAWTLQPNDGVDTTNSHVQATGIDPRNYQ